ncbi:MAG TPA: MBL fold metallo-hydrolase [Candidatus Saccharimonadales bacterium]|nr:MBL fold metallo-hydrolase [Candidatus Saccharimonadales bacterium]
MLINASKQHLVFAAVLTLSAAISSAFVPVAHAQGAPASAAVAASVRMPGFYPYRVGNFEIVALSDGTVPLDLHALMKGAPKGVVDKLLHRSFLSNPVESSINGFLIDTGTRLILVDTGAGDLFGPGAGGKLVANLKAAGYDPARIDDVLLTHIHPDHSGGLVHDGQRVFPHATVFVGKPDVNLFMDPAHQNGVDGYDKAYFHDAVLTLGPYAKAGKLKPFSGVTQILPGIEAIPTPGHTPGHSFYRVQSQGQSIEFVGDLVNSEAVQFPQPSITTSFDFSQSEAATQRIKQFGELAGKRELIAAAHLPFPGLGHIRKAASGWTFVPVDYRNGAGK